MKNPKSLNKSSIAISVALAVGLPGSALAQLEEIVVTAQKRTQSSQDVPIAINALNGEMLESMGVRASDDVEKIFPNLSTNNRSAVNSGFAIRGVGTNNYHISAKQSVGINIDGVATFTPFATTIGIYDMDRVEILRGPQNTLYGRNTTGGVINYYTRQARVADGTNGRAMISAGNGGLTEVEGAFGIAFTDNLAARIAVMDSNFDGTWTNLVDGNKVGRKDKKGARLNLAWDATDTTSVHLTLSTGKAEGDDEIKRTVGNLTADGSETCNARSAGESVIVAGQTDCWVRINASQLAGSDYLTAQYNSGNTAFIRDNAADGGATYLVNYSSPWGTTYMPTDVGGYSAEADGFQIAVKHDFESMALDWSSAYDKQKMTNITLYGGLTGFQGANQGDWEVWQHELRLTSNSHSALRWMVGAYLTSEESIEDTWVTHTENPAPDVNAFNTGPLSSAILIDSQYDGWSAYSQIDYDLSDQFSVSAGARYTKDKLEGHARKSNCTDDNSGVTASYSDTAYYTRAWRESQGCDSNGALLSNNPIQELSELGWKVSLNWKPTEDVLVYTSASTGFKGGAYDNRAQANGQQPVGPEFLDAYELGIKSEWFNKTVQLNAAYYLYDWQDQQLFATAPDRSPWLLNVPSIKMQGIEIELKWAPTETLFVQAGLGLSDHEVSKLSAELEVLGWRKGYQVTNTPEKTANVLLVNTIPLGVGEIVLQGAYRYMDSFYYVACDELCADNTRSDAHGWIDGRITYKFGTDIKYSVALWGNNLTEEKTLNQNSPEGLPGLHNFPGGVRDPGVVMWGLTLEASF